jgi:hypothetical protein
MEQSEVLGMYLVNRWKASALRFHARLRRVVVITATEGRRIGMGTILPEGVLGSL